MSENAISALFVALQSAICNYSNSDLVAI